MSSPQPRRRVDHMNFGPGSLSRLECGGCKETTLHKHNKCIHCGTVFAPPPASGTRLTWNRKGA